MPIQNSLIKTVTLPLESIEGLINDNCKLREQAETADKVTKLLEQRVSALEEKNAALENRKTELESIENRYKGLIQLVDADSQSSKIALQYVCTIVGAILGGATLAFPPFGAAAIGAATALGAGSAAVSVSTVGVALLGGATGGCVVAPFIHGQQHNALIQHVKLEEERAANQS